MQVNQLKHEKLPPQIRFSTLTYDNKIKPVQYLVKLETVLPSQKDDCHCILADLRKDQISIVNIDGGENFIDKPQYFFPLKL